MIAAASAQESTYVREHYVKSEHQIAMRDGAKLYTIVYAPRDTTQFYPIILIRTPYSVAPYGPDKFASRLRPSDALMREGYIFAYQDVRGRYMSEGDWVELRPINPNKQKSSDIDETTDSYDTVDWLVKNIRRNNGRVGITGISYPGFYASMGTIDAHPAVKATSPQAPIADDFIGDDDHHHGAFFLTAAFNFYASFGWPRTAPSPNQGKRFDHGTPDGYQFFLDLGPLSNANQKYFHGQLSYWNDMMEHGTYDEHWQRLNVLPHLKDIKPAVMTVGGWFDAEDLYGPLKTYQTIEKNNPGAVNILVMGPWAHGQWASRSGERLGAIDFGSNTAEYFQQNIELPFFNYYLKEKGKLNLPEATIFLTGANEWRSFDRWPPKNVTTQQLYLRENGKLSFSAPPASQNPYDEYLSDPSKPVPFTADITTGFPRTYMIEDQRFAATRPDVLVYQSDILRENVTVAGPIIASLFVSTSGTDSDWIVKLIDVLPDSSETPSVQPPTPPLGGYQMMVRGEVFRGKFRNSYSKPEPFIPGQVTKVEYELQDVFHCFKKAHRIMVQIQSSWFPLVDRNPQKFVDIYHARESDYQKATQRVFRTSDYPSHLKLNILPNSQ